MNIHILIRIFIENINRLKLYKNRKLKSLDNGGHKMTAVSKEFYPLNNGGHKMTAVSKEIQPLDNVLVTGGAQKSLGISNLAPRGKMWN